MEGLGLDTEFMKKSIAGVNVVLTREIFSEELFLRTISPETLKIMERLRPRKAEEK